MKDNGWNIDVTYDYDGKFSLQCSNATWFGFKWNNDSGTVNATFMESGTAILNFGNCAQGDSNSLVIVKLNHIQIGRAESHSPETEITFPYSEGSALSIQEVGTGIIALNSLRILGT